MVGKLVRAVSGLKAALALAEMGYIIESAALLRLVSDFCTEITAIGEAVRSGDFPAAVRRFVDDYFTQRARTPAELAASAKPRYVSREELMKGEMRLTAGTEVDPEQMRDNHRFVNMTFDAYVHGAYETTMELYHAPTGRFALSGYPGHSRRRELVEFTCMKLHEVVRAIELTAAVTSNEPIFKAARNARHMLDAD